MRRLAAALVAAATVVGACGDTAEPREVIETVPFDPVADLVDSATTLATAPPTTIDVSAAARDWFGLLAEGRGLDEVPAEAWNDFVRAGCDEEIWDRGVNFALAEDFSILPFSSIEAISTDQVLVAQLLWLKSLEACHDQFPAGAVDRGPPSRYEYPRCRHPLELWALPWSDEVGETDTGEDHSLGLTFYGWAGAGGTLLMIQGADPSFDEAYHNGTAIGDINGDAAVSLGGVNSVQVLWRTSEWHCGAFRLEFSPVPETDDLAGFVEWLLTPPDGSLTNLAEERMSAVIGIIEGYRKASVIGANTDQDAQMLFAGEEHQFDVVVAPLGLEGVHEPPGVTSVFELEGTVFELFDDDGEGVRRGATFVSDDHHITIRTDSDDEQLIAFALEFRRAWLAAAPVQVEG